LQYPAQTFIDSMHLIESGHQEINGESDPDLGAHGVFGRAIERLDAQVLFDPLEEEFDLPAALVDRGNRKSGEIEVVCKKDQLFSGFRIEITDTAQPPGKVPLALFGLEADGLVAPQAGRFIDRPRFEDIETCVALGADHEIRTGRLDSEQSGEIEIATIKNVDASGLVIDLIHEVDVVDRTVGDPHEYGDWAGEIDLSVKLDRRFGGSEMRPGKDRQAQIDGGSINGINHLVEIKTVGVTDIQPSRLADENLSECFVNAPVSMLVRVSQIRSGNVTSNAHCIAVSATSETGFNVAETLPESDLRESHRDELVSSGHTPAFPRHPMQRHTALKLLAVQRIENLSEYQASGVHPLLRMKQRRYGQPVQMRDTSFSSLAT